MDVEVLVWFQDVKDIGLFISWDALFKHYKLDLDLPIMTVQ